MTKFVLIICALTGIISGIFAQPTSSDNRLSFLKLTENKDSSNSHNTIHQSGSINMFEFKDSLISANTGKSSIFSKIPYFRKKTNQWTFLGEFAPEFSVAYEKSTKKTFKHYGIGAQIATKYKDFLFAELSITRTRSNLFDNSKIFADSTSIFPYSSIHIEQNKTTYTASDIAGIISYRANDNMTFSAGKGSFFIGNGIRSLLLSDASGQYPFFSAEISFWKVKYLWITALLRDFNLIGSNYPLELFDKYAYIHYISYDLTKRINFGFFEAVISSPQTEYGNKGIDVAYMNPVIFYRPVEFGEGSSDNALLGLTGSIRFFSKLYLYGQIMLDEFLIAELKARKGWWGNKQGYQAGMRWINPFGTEKLLISGEYNYLRPYTYTHHYRNINYGAFGQELAHPNGANFKEMVFYLKKEFRSVGISLKIQNIEKGIDKDSVSYGGNIYKSYDLRQSDYNNAIVQGVYRKSTNFELSFSFFPNPTYRTELYLTLFYEKSSFLNSSNTIIFAGIKSELTHRNFSHKFDF